MPKRTRTRTWMGLVVVGVLMATALPASAAAGTRLWASRYDSAAHKATYPALHGVEASLSRAHALVEAALSELEGFGPGAEPLRSIACFVVERRK